MVRATAFPDTFREGELDRLSEAWAAPGALTAMLNWYRAGFRRKPGTFPKRVEAPTLILFGRHDRAEQPGLMTESLKLCDLGRLVEIEESSHWVQRDAAERVNQELLDFLLPNAAPIESPAEATRP
jgi:pimeloyl-ACP methyl ester carboxylesterase